jgi:hypothetical protein
MNSLAKTVETSFWVNLRPKRAARTTDLVFNAGGKVSRSHAFLSASAYGYQHPTRKGSCYSPHKSSMPKPEEDK